MRELEVVEKMKEELLVYRYGNPKDFKVIETKGTGLKPIAENLVHYPDEEPM